MNSSDYTKICFVIMPFGKKPVGDKTINFDEIYDSVFEPAIRASSLPEGGNLIARRTDRDFYSGDISVEMFQYLEYSRFALADISGLNANVFYELGARHRAREAGTAIFRQAGVPLPFDINKIKAFDYSFESKGETEESKQLITRVLQESLEHNRLDSPVQSALSVQQRDQKNIEILLTEAENAIRNEDEATAILKYKEAVKAQSTSPLLRLRLGILLKEDGELAQALEQFRLAINYSPSYAEAYRELGIVENKLFNARDPSYDGADGEDSLRRAIQLNPGDFDALASLGGVLKRKGQFSEALQMYRRATEVSKGHTYPLLNELKLEARVAGKLELDRKRQFQLKRAQRNLREQVKHVPPYNAPWSFFDLAEIRLYQTDSEGFLENLEAGLLICDAAWQAETFRNSLQLLVDGGVSYTGLEEGLARLDEAIEVL